MGNRFSTADFASMKVTSSTLGYLLGGVDKKTIERYAKDGLAVRVGHGRYLLGPSIHNITKRLREQAAGRLGRTDDVDAVRSSAELRDAQRRLTEIRAAKLSGELISLPDIEDAWREIGIATRQLFLSLPARARFDLPHLTGEDQKALERLVRDMLREVATEGPMRIPSTASTLSG
jgi:phage terminase Nu1 subunit (DNA packaging protein)